MTITPTTAQPIYICTPGDPSVGLQGEDVLIQFDPEAIEEDDRDTFRRELGEFWEKWLGEKVAVHFPADRDDDDDYDPDDLLHAHADDIDRERGPERNESEWRGVECVE